MAGICSKQTWRAYAEPISILHDIVAGRTGQRLNPFLRISGKDDLPERDVAVQSEGEGVHKLGRVRDECEQGDPKELFVDTRPLKNDIDHVDQNLWISINFFSRALPNVLI
jgi:hypothetical protein